MNSIIRLLSVIFIVSLISCGGGEEKKEKTQVKIGGAKTETEKPATPSTSNGIVIDMNNKGLGPIKNIDLPDTIDQAMVASGAEVYKLKCTACHKADKKFIGPAPTGILERRSPEWIMNMILDPEGMVKNDPIAKQLLIEYNGSPMANQNLTEVEARAVLEYFRTLK